MKYTFKSYFLRVKNSDPDLDFKFIEGYWAYAEQNFGSNISIS